MYLHYRTITTEPGTQGKVLIKTNHGDMDIELWPKEAPLACRNFVQLCLEGYFDRTIVHRIIKGMHRPNLLVSLKIIHIKCEIQS